MTERQTKKIVKAVGEDLAKKTIQFALEDFDEMDDKMWGLVGPLFSKTFTEANLKAQMFPLYVVSAQTGMDMTVSVYDLAQPLLRDFNEQLNANPVLRMLVAKELLDKYVERYGSKKAITIIRENPNLTFPGRSTDEELVE